MCPQQPCPCTTEHPSTAAGVLVPMALELLPNQSSGGWMLPSRRAHGLLLGMEQWGKASYAAGSVLTVLRNGVAKWRSCGTRSRDCAAVEMMEKRLDLSFPRFWLQKLEHASVLKIAKIESGLGGRHSHNGKCWTFLSSGVGRMTSALYLELLIRSRCRAFVAVKGWHLCQMKFLIGLTLSSATAPGWSSKLQNCETLYGHPFKTLKGWINRKRSLLVLLAKVRLAEALNWRRGKQGSEVSGQPTEIQIFPSDDVHQWKLELEIKGFKSLWAPILTIKG